MKSIQKLIIVLVPILVIIILGVAFLYFNLKSYNDSNVAESLKQQFYSLKEDDIKAIRIVSEEPLNNSKSDQSPTNIVFIKDKKTIKEFLNLKQDWGPYFPNHPEYYREYKIYLDFENGSVKDIEFCFMKDVNMVFIYTEFGNFKSSMTYGFAEKLKL